MGHQGGYGEDHDHPFHPPGFEPERASEQIQRQEKFEQGRVAAQSRQERSRA